MFRSVTFWAPTTRTPMPVISSLGARSGAPRSLEGPVNSTVIPLVRMMITPSLFASRIRPPTGSSIRHDCVMTVSSLSTLTIGRGSEAGWEAGGEAGWGCVPAPHAEAPATSATDIEIARTIQPVRRVVAMIVPSRAPRGAKVTDVPPPPGFFRSDQHA